MDTSKVECAGRVFWRVGYCRFFLKPYFFLLIAGLFGMPAHALTIHYDSSRGEALMKCDQLSYRGHREQAQRCYTRLYESSEGLERAGAAAALGDTRNANKLYRELVAESDNPAIKTQWGQLYLQTHQVSDAEALFREALLYDEDYLPAKVGLANAISRGFEGRAREQLNQITAQHPDSVQALVLLARIELELQNLTVARGLLNRALSEVNEQNLPPLEIYALHAGAQLLEAKPMSDWIERALQYNPQYGAIYAIPAHFYIITYRYREAVDLYQKAVSLDPDLATAHRDLGINQLRINNIFSARYHLQKAYELDPYDIQTVNTLRLLDDLDEMRVSSVDVPDPDDPEKVIGRVLIRLDREDADALEPYVIDLSVRAVQLFTQRYDFQLRQPMVVELYHDHDDFGVRTVSTPGIGLLGVTFGYLTAMDSPKARAACRDGLAKDFRSMKNGVLARCLIESCRWMCLRLSNVGSCCLWSNWIKVSSGLPTTVRYKCLICKRVWCAILLPSAGGMRRWLPCSRRLQIAKQHNKLWK